MEIICDPNQKPGKQILDKMKKGAELCVKAEGLDPKTMEVSLTFVSNSEIRELNKLYRGIDKVTDVLSFPQYEELNPGNTSKEILLGDVVICTEQALLQADELGHSNERELVYLFIHSVCHLLGHNHTDEREKEKMRYREEEIMTAIQVKR